jgi:hypothetical protein
MTPWFVIGGAPADAPAVAAFAAGLDGRACVLHPPFSDRAALDWSGVESRAVGVDLIAMNGPEEERAFMEAERFGARLAARLGPVPLGGLDLAACLPSLLDMRVERTLILAAALDALKAEAVAHAVVWFRSFTRFHLAAADLGAHPGRAAVLRAADGALTPMPALQAVHPFDPVGARVIARAAAQEPAGGGAAGAAAGGGLTVMLATRSAGYLAEAAPVLDALDAAGEPFRLLLADAADAAALGPAAARAAAEGRLGTVEDGPDPAWTADEIADALRALFARIEALAPGAPDDPVEAALERIAPLARHASAHRQAHRACRTLGRLAARLERDGTDRLFFYPSRTAWCPGPRMLMRARGGTAATAIFRSITADHRNFRLPDADALAVLGADQAAIAAARGFPAARVREVGAPSADAAFGGPPPTREAGGPRRILAATSGFDRAGEPAWMAALAAEARRRPGAQLIIRPHPSLGDAPYRAAVGEDDDAVRIDRRGDIHALIDGSDAVLTDVSHVGKLAVYRGRALGVVNMTGVPFPYTRFDEAGVAAPLTDAAALRRFAAQVFDGAPPQADAAARARFVRAEFASDDGRSGARMAAFLRDPLAPAAGGPA